MPIAPIIQIGMHRSGTTLLALLLEDLGVFSGIRGGANREARYFNRSNKWVFSQHNATWDRPDNMACGDERLRGHMERVLALNMSGPGIVFYLGPAAALRYRDLRRLDFPWTWKDPRNSFTVDLWKRVFPEARILHIHRHPIDVAISLKRREEQRLATYRHTWWHGFRERFTVRGPLYCHSSRLLDLREGFRLWEQYVSASFERSKPFADDVLHCSFEDLAEKPAQRIGEIASFLGLEPSPERIARAARRVNPERSLAFRLERGRVGAAGLEPTPLMRRLGYSCA